MARTGISVVVPALNEAEYLGPTLECARCAAAELIVVDGGSTDATRSIAADHGARVLRTATGRALQMNAGAAVATTEALLFLHADTLLPPDYETEVLRILDDSEVAAGAFRLGISASPSIFRLIESVANGRSRWLQRPYGDQALFLKVDCFRSCGGFPDLPIMEDFELIRRLRRTGRIRIAAGRVRTSPRRWLRHGPWRTTMLNQLAVTAYLLGVAPARIARWIGRIPT